MTEYFVLQPKLTNDQIRKINQDGWEGNEAGKAYMAALGGREERTVVALKAGIYAHGFTVEAEDLAALFTVTNYMPTDKAHVTWRSPRASSGSVGDVVLSTDGNHAWVCAMFGWEPLSDETIALIKGNVLMEDGRMD